ncbi:hypothetical protein [Deinococcus soli (ex Cha et al. 2016)]|uniref:Tfp pilus assembly protein PilW n=2 Tax=Deinococcus soli (ex Cha et al. 2016) TaxID=1309411 RepID=A0AAE4BLY3_9DEIO|nr:hypothetical protein [Deinococcus soli (ex Cha et al. 2016)]MDR6218495.1 Tfp pilus assembly protein PilW [Deinococcus soli (ex Cha et al. 2016)]MDR6329235.1 Tfp pilus assembly protein PilW [Deinococcus soli (ex Cha et al. 2016)]MDR6751508.1 Tfp pilus assembly protein PilW [Deinococcus soli (ex Cha et al. 2016)]
MPHLSAPRTPPSRRHGLSLVELLAACTIGLLLASTLTVTIAGSLHANNDQKELTNASSTARRTSDFLNTVLTGQPFLAVTQQTTSGASFLFLDRSASAGVLDATWTESTMTLTHANAGFKPGDQAVLINSRGEASVLTITDVRGAVVTHAPCDARRQNAKVEYTPGTVLYRAQTTDVVLGRGLGNDRETTLLYRRGTGPFQDVAYDLSSFRIRYLYRNERGALTANPTLSAGYSASYPQNQLRAPDGQLNQLQAVEFSLASRKGSSANQRSLTTQVNVAYTGAPPVQRLHRCETLRQPGVRLGGDLTVIVQGLPSTAQGRVTVNGPSLRNAPLHTTTTFTDLRAGQYTLTPQDVTINRIRYRAATDVTQVNDWSGTVHVVTYAPVMASLAVEIAGLPARVQPDVRLRALAVPQEYALTVQTQGLDLKPGDYDLRVRPVRQGQSVYAATPADLRVTLNPDDAQHVKVTYAAEPGRLSVQYRTAVDLNEASLTLMSPTGRTWKLTVQESTPQLLKGLPPGGYTWVSDTDEGSGTLTVASNTTTVLKLSRKPALCIDRSAQNAGQPLPCTYPQPLNAAATPLLVNP